MRSISSVFLYFVHYYQKTFVELLFKQVERKVREKSNENIKSIKGNNIQTKEVEKKKKLFFF